MRDESGPSAGVGCLKFRTIELDEALASLAVDHCDGGLLAPEGLDLGTGNFGRLNFRV